LNFSLQPLDRFLILSKSFFELKTPVEVTYPPDQDSQKNKAKDNQKKRKSDFWNFEPLVIRHGEENEPKGNRVLILNAKKEKE
jgi:hypothetical protein